MISRVTILTCCVLVLVIETIAQVPTFKLSQKFVHKIESISIPEQKLRAYKKYFHRDSVKFNRALKKYYKYYGDSLRGVMNSNFGKHQLDTVSTLPTSTLIDSIRDQAQSKIKTRYSKEKFQEKYLSGKLNTLANVPSKDSMLNSVMNKDGLLQNKYDISATNALSDTVRLKEEIRKKSEELASKYLADNPASIRNIQNKMDRLMKKYAIVPNSNDLTTAVKRTSLSGRSFKERLYLAGNFQLPSWKPLSIDFSPAIGYRINSKWIAGVGITYRKTFGDSTAQIANTVWGYKAFLCYEIVNRFFVYTEIAVNTPLPHPPEQANKPVRTVAALLGVGRTFMAHPKLETTIVGLYNFLYDRLDPIYQSPWNVRVGFQTSLLSFKRR